MRPVRSVNDVYSKPEPDRLQQMEHHETLHQHENELLKRNWRDVQTVADT